MRCLEIIDGKHDIAHPGYFTDFRIRTIELPYSDDTIVVEYISYIMHATVYCQNICN